MQLATTLAFDEELVIVAPCVHPAITCAQDVGTDTIICFPVGCAYRRLLHAWLAAGNIVPEKVLELSSYHADELVLVYEVEASHRRICMAQLVSFLVLHRVPDGR